MPQQELDEAHRHFTDAVLALTRVWPDDPADADEMLAIARLLTEAQGRLLDMSASRREAARR